MGIGKNTTSVSVDMTRKNESWHHFHKIWRHTWCNVMNHPSTANNNCGIYSWIILQKSWELCEFGITYDGIKKDALNE